MSGGIKIRCKAAYKTRFGSAYCGDSQELLCDLHDRSVNLVVTSPPFALQRKKSYGNEDQRQYVDWLTAFGRIIFDKLADDGSFVLDLGGAYQKGVPVRSLYNYRVLLRFCDELGFHLAEEFFWHNTSKLPSPIEWVNKRKIRAKDSVNTIWWFSKTEWPKADIRRVLVPYSERMKKLLKDPKKFYTPAKRPSGHDISASFGKGNRGAIPSNLLQIANSGSLGRYESACKRIGVERHPARFPMKLPRFFIEMLTDPNDLVVDVFAGSNTTGEVAQALGRNWLSFELNREYVAASAFRFIDHGDAVRLRDVFDRIAAGETVDLSKGEVVEGVLFD